MSRLFAKSKRQKESKQQRAKTLRLEEVKLPKAFSIYSIERNFYLYDSCRIFDVSVVLICYFLLCRHLRIWF